MYCPRSGCPNSQPLKSTKSVAPQAQNPCFVKDHAYDMVILDKKEVENKRLTTTMVDLKLHKHQNAP